jgi:hypothetical protein
MAEDTRISDLPSYTSASPGDFIPITDITSGSTKKIRTDNLFNSAKFGSSTDYTSFEADGIMVMTGSAMVWDDIFFPLTSAKQGVLDKPPFDPDEIAYKFPPNDTSNIMYLVIQFPHFWAIGTDIEPHIHWKQIQSGSIVFKMEYKWFDIGGQIPNAYTTYIINENIIPYTSGSLHQLTAGSAHISGSSITGISSMMLVKLYRDDNTYAPDVIGYHFDIHIKKDTIGSRTDLTK